jgi:hypothetical protein
MIRETSSGSTQRSLFFASQDCPYSKGFTSSGLHGKTMAQIDHEPLNGYRFFSIVSLVRLTFNPIVIVDYFNKLI